MKLSPADSTSVRPATVTSNSAFRHITRLHMRVRVKRANGTLLEAEFHYHQFICVQKNAAAASRAGCHPLLAFPV